MGTEYGPTRKGNRPGRSMEDWKVMERVFVMPATWVDSDTWAKLQKGEGVVAEVRTEDATDTGRVGVCPRTSMRTAGAGCWVSGLRRANETVTVWVVEMAAVTQSTNFPSP